MAAFSENVKVYVVQRLACFDSLDSILQGVKEDFNITASKPQLLAYDPNKVQGRNLSKKLKEIFQETRTKFLEDTSSIPIANKAVRLKMLQGMAERAVNSKNSVLAASLLEQAAKEVGDAYTNRYKIDSSLTIKAGDLGDAIGDLSRD